MHERDVMREFLDFEKSDVGIVRILFPSFRHSLSLGKRAALAPSAVSILYLFCSISLVF